MANREVHAPAGTLFIFAHILAFTSGALALVYEVLWLRHFTALFGATAPAASATLAAIFLGLAAGAAIVGRRCAHWPRPLRAYALLEAAAGLSALLFNPLLGLYDRWYGGFYARFADNGALFVAVKTALAMAALFLPTLLMGGSLPALAQAVIKRRGDVGAAESGLYAVNTAGAVIGALSVPFWLLPGLGAHSSYLLAVASSLSLGLVSFILDLKYSSTGHAQEAQIATKKPDNNSLLSVPMIAVLAVLSGLTMLAVEVVWTRMLAQVHENSIYSFAVVIAIFLAGLAAGAALGRILLNKSFDTGKLLGTAWLAAGLLIFVSPQLFYLLTDKLDYVKSVSGAGSLTTLQLAVVVMLPATLIAGMVLPLLLRMAGRQRQEQAGPLLGNLLAVNTAGAVAGSLFATYALLPLIGLWLSIALIGLVMIACGEAVFIALRAPAATRRLVTATLLIIITIAGNPFTLPRAHIDKERGERLVHLREGSHGIVAVLENDNDRWMALDNYYTLGGTASAIEERQQAHIPLLLHPAPRKVAFIGLGTGITAGAVLSHDIEKVTALELVPEVIATAGSHFSQANAGLLADPRVTVVAEDARTYLKNRAESYDVIIGDLVVPWRKGEASLFTREHFAAVRQALAPQGIFCQWLPLYQLSQDQFQIIAATFLSVFPNATLWRGDFLADIPSVALISAPDRSLIDIQAIDGRAQARKSTAERLEPILADPAGLWLFLIGPLNAAQFASTRVNSESTPWIELSNPVTNSSSSKRFVGRAWERYLAEMLARPLTNTPLTGLSDIHKNWRDAGTKLWQASLLINEGREQEGEALAIEALTSLPTDLQRAITGQ